MKIQISVSCQKLLKSLEILDVEKNLFSGGAGPSVPDYPTRLFSELPQLKSVDYKDVAGREFNDDDDEEEEDDDDDDDDEGEYFSWHEFDDQLWDFH